MDIYRAIKNRYSVRDYKLEPVPKQSLENILSAGRLAPSGHNKQPWKFVVVQNEDKKRKLARAAHHQDFVGQAPIVIVAVGLEPDYVMSCGISACAVNLAIAVSHMILAAVAEGLGTCWIGAFDQNQVRDVLNIPEKYKVVALLPLGFPADRPGPKIRKNLSEVVCYDDFSE